MKETFDFCITADEMALFQSLKSEAIDAGLKIFPHTEHIAIYAIAGPRWECFLKFSCYEHGGIGGCGLATDRQEAVRQAIEEARGVLRDKLSKGNNA